MTGDEKKKRDPIFTVCFVVFILAAVSVVGVYVDEHYLTEDTTKAAYGDTVEVRYTGTFYAYYGEENAVVFDTNISSIADDDAIIKSNSFTGGSDSLLDFTVGGSDVLTDFGNAVVGRRQDQGDSPERLPRRVRLPHSVHVRIPDPRRPGDDGR